MISTPPTELYKQTQDDAHLRDIHAIPTYPQQLHLKTGLEIMQTALREDWSQSGIGCTLDFFLAEVGEGFAEFHGEPSQMHMNFMGGVHGGWYAALLDSALGCAIHTMIPIGRGYTTAELNVNIVRAAKPGTGLFRAVGKVLHCGRQLATAEGKLIGADGKLYAHASTTCIVFALKTQ
jgi:uncharacterized protein (TIGR00369 family)